VRRVLEWSVEVGLVRVLEVFDTDYGQCGGREATSLAGIMSWYGALLACVKGRGFRVLHDLERRCTLSALWVRSARCRAM
jgi:hypothetical protein